MKNSVIKFVAAAGAGAALVAAGAAISGGDSSTATAGTGTPPGAAASMPYGQPGFGRPPRDFGSEVTGEDAKKAGAAATAKYPGTVERVVKLPDGSYIVHVITKDGEQHVAVSKAFEVTGTQQGFGGHRGPGAGGRPGFGTEATGEAAKKAAAAATAKYKGTVERVMKLPDGSYIVHVITNSGEQHVAVSKAFEVTGTEQGGPGRGGHFDAPSQGGDAATKPS